MPLDTGCKSNIYKTFKRRLGPDLNVLCTSNLCPVSMHEDVYSLGGVTSPKF